MNLRTKKILASKTLKVGKNRIQFVKSRMDEIKEAITKQDIRDLKDDGAIKIKDIKGRRKTKKARKRTAGNVRKKINKRKQEYVKSTRLLRKTLKEMLKQEKVNKEQYKDIRKKIRNKRFKSQAVLKEYINNLEK